MQGTGKGKHIGQEEYDRIKNLLNTRSPLELSQAGVCGYSTAYKIMSTTGYGDYRNKLREDREKFYAKRKATQIKRNVPPIGGGHIRFEPPKKALDGTGNTTTVFGSPFRENPKRVPKEKPKDGPVVVVKAGTAQPEAVIDVKSGPAPTYEPAKTPIVLPYPQAVYDATEARAHNAKISVSKDGIDAFRYVDLNSLTITRGKRPQGFSQACVLGLTSLARNGATRYELGKYLREAGHGNKSIDQIMRTLALDKEGLENFKEAYKQGEKVREEREAKKIQENIANARRARMEGLTAERERMRNARPLKTLEQAMADPKVDKIYLTAEPVKEEPKPEPKLVVTTQSVKKATDNVAPKQTEEVMKKKKIKVIEIDGDSLNPELVIDRAYRAKNEKLVKKVKIKRKHMSYSTIFLLGAQLTVFSLKLTGAIDLSWAWTFLPIYILGAGLFLECFFLGALTLSFFLDYVKENGGTK